ncbi:MAG: polysaccharide synthesis protein GtrA [Methylophilaceae bacterium 17-44-8]|jgi:putative flippase GtrA|nr:MAG: polysaccharide synthesis protein GtrA [Methylophilales bacterium 16-45-7]OZA04508.1 MAG: polysaccharide synthesis protein GtrA [Methylophilaceae bacterium 17-44-8]
MKADMQTLKRSISWFLVVGAIAALVHYAMAVTLEGMYSVRPAWSNIIGFCAAFPVSYLGHRHFSFSGQSSSHQQALPRFLAVAILGFLANQTLVLLGLHFTALPFWSLLALVMIVVAIGTYLLSKHWAF